MRKTYSELIKISSFKDRLEYLSLNGKVGNTTFGGHRYMNQMLYHSERWKTLRNKIILRDEGCDLAHDDYPIFGSIYIHHINPISMDDISNERACVFDPENLICAAFQTHNAIHYGLPEPLVTRIPTVRERYDTCPWR